MQTGFFISLKEALTGVYLYTSIINFVIQQGLGRGIWNCKNTENLREMVLKEKIVIEAMLFVNFDKLLSR